MTEQKKHTEDKTGTEMLAEIGRLLLLLLWKMVRSILRIIIKSVILLIRLIKQGVKQCVDFWNDNNTQEKLRKARRSIKHGSKVFAEWMMIALHTIIRLIIRGIKSTIQGIIHLKPTIIKAGEYAKYACIAFGRFMKRAGRGIRLSHIKRKRAYKRFRKNKGFKGLLKDLTNLLKTLLQNYMEEEQNEVSPDAVTEDDIIMEGIEGKSKAYLTGKKLFSSVRNIVDIDEEETGK
ncbi:MAG: hypothetical protein NC206_01480 [Bacteroides sp.]|nr:hypothetical protein [Roseburia sp.]MCM1345742.1 hypothetical protein [Bacteroides sp.]MCM1420163.1 hypothetical protein [Bacteroides sp.]